MTLVEYVTPNGPGTSNVCRQRCYRDDAESALASHLPSVLSSSYSFFLFVPRGKKRDEHAK